MRYTAGHEKQGIKCLHVVFTASRQSKVSRCVGTRSIGKKTTHLRETWAKKQLARCVQQAAHLHGRKGGAFAGPFWAPKLVNANLLGTVVGKILLTAFVFQTGAKNGAPKMTTKAFFFERFSRHHCLAKMAASCFLSLHHSGSNAHCHARPEHILHELARAYHDLARARFASRSHQHTAT